MNVQIVEEQTGIQIGIFPISLGGSLGKTESDYFDEAWRCAVEDRLVEPNERAQYEFKIVVG